MRSCRSLQRRALLFLGVDLPQAFPLLLPQRLVVAQALGDPADIQPYLPELRLTGVHLFPKRLSRPLGQALPAFHRQRRCPILQSGGEFGNFLYQGFLPGRKPLSYLIAQCGGEVLRFVREPGLPDPLGQFPFRPRQLCCPIPGFRLQRRDLFPQGAELSFDPSLLRARLLQGAFRPSDGLGQARLLAVGISSHRRVRGGKR